MNRCGFVITGGHMETAESVNLKMIDTQTEQSIREICNTAIDACSVMYNDNILGKKQLALLILEELDNRNDET